MIDIIKILVVDDEVVIAEHLKDILNELGFEHVEIAHNKLQSVQKISNFNPDLVLLDIRMKEELEGIAIAEIINKTFKIPFIFISAHSDKEIIKKALNTNPVGYLTKPFKKMDVYAIINLAIKKDFKNLAENVLVFKDSYTIVKLNINDIFYVQSDGNYIHLITLHKKFTIRYSLDWFIENVPKNQFRQIHRSYVINLEKIQKITSKSVLINNVEIPISRNKKIGINDI